MKIYLTNIVVGITLAIASASALAGEPPSAHNPCYDQKGLWPEDVKETAYYKEKWEPARLLVWANVGKGAELDNIYLAANWLEDGKPATTDGDKTCDIVFPDQDRGKQLVIEAGFACRHLTIGKGVRVTRPNGISGNLYSRGNFNTWYTTLGGTKNTFLYNTDNLWKTLAVDKRGGASVETVTDVGVMDWLEINNGSLIVGNGCRLMGGNRHQNIVAPKDTLVLTSGSVFTTLDPKPFAFDLEVFGTVLAGTTERPLTKDCFFQLNMKLKGKSQGQNPGDRSIKFTGKSSLVITSADPAKARLVFQPRTDKDTGLDGLFGGKMSMDGVLFDGFALGGIQMTDLEQRKTWKHLSFGEKNAGKEDALFSATGAVGGQIHEVMSIGKKQLDEEQQKEKKTK